MITSIERFFTKKILEKEQRPCLENNEGANRFWLEYFNKIS